MPLPIAQGRGILEEGQGWVALVWLLGWVTSGKTHMAELTTAAFSLTWGYFNDRDRVKENFLLWPLPTSSGARRSSIWDFLESRFAVGRAPKQSLKLMRAHERTRLCVCTLLVHPIHTRGEKNIPLLFGRVHASTRTKPHKREKRTLVSYQYWVTLNFHQRCFDVWH